MPANYDNAAWFYDQVSYLVFGQAQVKAQLYFLHHIKPNSRILIAGGGTGKILEALTRLYPDGLQIVYAEISAKMMALSRRRNIGNNNVQFVTADVGTLVSDHPFDVIITPFLFDNFTEPAIQQVFKNLHQQLKPGGLWLHTDFRVTGQLWQKLLLKTMYRFFKLLCGVQANRLPDMDSLFVHNAYRLAGEQYFYGRFIQSQAYYKQG